MCTWGRFRCNSGRSVARQPACYAGDDWLLAFKLLPNINKHFTSGVCEAFESVVHSVHSACYAAPFIMPWTTQFHSSPDNVGQTYLNLPRTSLNASPSCIPESAPVGMWRDAAQRTQVQKYFFTKDNATFPEIFLYERQRHLSPLKLSVDRSCVGQCQQSSFSAGKNANLFIVDMCVFPVKENGASSARWCSCLAQVSAWGGYVFIINLIPLHVFVLLLMGRFSRRLYIGTVCVCVCVVCVCVCVCAAHGPVLPPPLHRYRVCVCVCGMCVCSCCCSWAGSPAAST